MEGTGSAELSKRCRLCPGLSLQHPQIPVWTEAKHPGTNPTFVPFPPLFRSGRKPGNESSGEGSLQAGAASFIPVLLSCSGPSASLEHPMDKTPQRSDKKAPQPQIFPVPRGLRLFSCPPSARVGCKRRLRALRPPSRCWSQPGAARWARAAPGASGPGPDKFPVSR